MRELVVRGKSILESDRKDILKSLDLLDADADDMVKTENVIELVKRMKQASVFAIGAEKLKVHEYAQKARQKEVNLARHTGLVLAKWSRGRGKKSAHDPTKFGITKQEVSRWIKIAKMPDYAYNYALKKASLISVNWMLGEIKRYENIKTAVKEAKGSDDQLKRYVTKGYSVLEAEIDISESMAKKNKPKKKKGEVLSEEIITEMEDDEPITFDFALAMNSFDRVAGQLDLTAEDMKIVFQKCEDITKDAFDMGLRSLKRMRKSVSELTELFKQGRSRVK